MLDLGNTLTAVMLTYPTLRIPFCAWLLMGYVKSVPPELLSAGIFAFTLAQNEFLYVLIFLTTSEVRTVPVGAITELIRGDVFYWGQLVVAVIYSFVEHYVAGLTAGSVRTSG